MWGKGSALAVLHTELEVLTGCLDVLLALQKVSSPFVLKLI